MMWHGMALAHGALTDSSCGAPRSQEMVVALTNKVWLSNGVGGGNGYHPSWAGPHSLGRTVAAVGVDQAHKGGIFHLYRLCLDQSHHNTTFL